MKAVILDVPQHLLEQRRRTGADRFDEIWGGVYHMGPPPSGSHQRIVDALLVLFTNYATRYHLGSLLSTHGVRDTRSQEEDYRIPEWLFLRAEHEDWLRSEASFIDRGPDLVLEVRSPGDETDEKVSFYEKMSVGELLIVDRDSRMPDLFRLSGGKLTRVPAAADGWVTSEALQASFQASDRLGRRLLHVRLQLDGSEHAV